TQMGPLINQASLDRVAAFVDEAVAEGATLEFGGARIGSVGYFYQPTILGNVRSHMKVFQEEVFGPVVAVTRFTDEQHAVALANDSCFGLAASVWTSNVARAHRVSDLLEVGITWINAHHFNDPSSPWGGMKQSGMGRENGREAFYAYTQAKSVVVNYGPSPDWFGDVTARYG
ncbi:hypothetical protein HDU91_004434, partial [Kappamyces sp. JEL0680]